jgi:hypothetical protein
MRPAPPAGAKMGLKKWKCIGAMPHILYVWFSGI